MYLVALLALAAASAGMPQSLEQQRQRERELLFIGRQFSQALKDYEAAPLLGPAGSVPATVHPVTLQDLLRDPRVPFVRRALRRLYVDPFTGRADWGVVRDQAGGIVGVHSLSLREPLRRTGLEGVLLRGDGRSYRDWVFGLPAQEANP